MFFSSTPNFNRWFHVNLQSTSHEFRCAEKGKIKIPIPKRHSSIWLWLRSFTCSFRIWVVVFCLFLLFICLFVACLFQQIAIGAKKEYVFSIASTTRERLLIAFVRSLARKILVLREWRWTASRNILSAYTPFRLALLLVVLRAFVRLLSFIIISFYLFIYLFSRDSLLFFFLWLNAAAVVVVAVAAPIS